ncbi:Predicted oxidoreductase [Bizionia echini]|uniref:Predicted oxidoreductase n=1 Tax=Bizionia echini TaxID=649333 RepID=A0A1I4ZFC3_9FLAO|nr:aldo/keto reductase [Bizionia echini]SFN48918.1 Predicted oxidoreductase [Bizionia echini]
MTYSKIIAGTMTWGQWGKSLSKNDMMARLDHCLKENITTFDHADIYGGYTTENEFGHAFKESNIRREAVQFISKCGIQYMSTNRNNSVKHYDYSKEYIFWSVEQSLKNLQTEYLDTLLLHRPSPLMQPDDIAEAIIKLKKDGKIKHFGVSNFSASQIALLSKYIPTTVNQIEFSLTQHKAMHDGTLDYMQLHQIKPMAWSPLGCVFKDNTNQTLRIKKQLDILSEKYQATHDQLLLAWILKHPSGITPVIGTTNLERITQAQQATKIDLEIEDWFLILVASQGHKVP